jgi:hypothetical protein
MAFERDARETTMMVGAAQWSDRLLTAQAFSIKTIRFIIQGMKKRAVPSKNAANNNLERGNRSKPSRAYIHGLPGKFRGKDSLRL